MGVREIYIKKAERVDNYSIGEYVGKDKRWKEQGVFGSKEELVGYLQGNDKYVSGLRKRGSKLRINVEIGDKDIAKTIIDELKRIGFMRVSLLEEQKEKKELRKFIYPLCFLF